MNKEIFLRLHLDTSDAIVLLDKKVENRIFIQKFHACAYSNVTYFINVLTHLNINLKFNIKLEFVFPERDFR